MDNTNINVIPVTTVNTKKCICCGKTLPLDEFPRSGRGYKNICNTCYRKESGISDKFKDFMSRELIDELKARGYKGLLTKTIIKTVKL